MYLGFTYIELQMDELLPKSECRFYLGGMTLRLKHSYPKLQNSIQTLETKLEDMYGVLKKLFVKVVALNSSCCFEDKISISLPF